MRKLKKSTGVLFAVTAVLASFDIAIAAVPGSNEDPSKSLISTIGLQNISDSELLSLLAIITTICLCLLVFTMFLFIRERRKVRRLKRSIRSENNLQSQMQSRAGKSVSTTDNSETSSETNNKNIIVDSAKSPIAEQYSEIVDYAIEPVRVDYGKNVIFCDDVELNRTIFIELFNDTDMVIDDTEDGEETLYFFADSPDDYYDIIFLDVRMPGIDGYETLRRIRALERKDAKSIPIIMMTTTASREEAEKARALGASDIILKPIDINSVTMMIQKHLSDGNEFVSAGIPAKALGTHGDRGGVTARVNLRNTLESAAAGERVRAGSSAMIVNDKAGTVQRARANSVLIQTSGDIQAQTPGDIQIQPPGDIQSDSFYYYGDDPERKKSVVGRIFTWLIVLAILAAIGFAGYRAAVDRLTPPEAVEEPVVNVRIITAELTDINTNAIITGRLQAKDEASVMPKIPGQVTALYVEMGSNVRKGQTLFVLDSSQLNNTLNQATLALSDAKTNLDRTIQLYYDGIISRQTYEQAQSAFDAAEQAYNASLSAYADYTVTAPISGYVTAVNIAVGSIASQAVVALTIATTDTLEIEANLSESLINKIHLGDTVDVLIKSFSSEAFKGNVSTIAPAPLPGTLTYPIKITLDNPDDALKPGMFAEIVMASDTAESVLAIPAKAVIIRSGRQVVITLDPEDQVIINEVVTGMDNGDVVEIREGISEGDRVVVEGQTYLDVTSRVNVSP